MWVSTFHSFCSRFLRYEIKSLDMCILYNKQKDIIYVIDGMPKNGRLNGSNISTIEDQLQSEANYTITPLLKMTISKNEVKLIQAKSEVALCANVNVVFNESNDETEVDYSFPLYRKEGSEFTECYEGKEKLKDFSEKESVFEYYISQALNSKGISDEKKYAYIDMLVFFKRKIETILSQELRSQRSDLINGEIPIKDILKQLPDADMNTLNLAIEEQSEKRKMTRAFQSSCVGYYETIKKDFEKYKNTITENGLRIYTNDEFRLVLGYDSVKEKIYIVNIPIIKTKNGRPMSAKSQKYKLQKEEAIKNAIGLIIR